MMTVTTASLPTTGSQTKRWMIDQRHGLMVSRPAGVMGILNVTPDSFSDGGQHTQPAKAIAVGVAMVAAGASWLDVGGESSRPGALPVETAVELARVLPVISGLRNQGVTVPISIDTCKADVADAAMVAGASAINDISAGRDPHMFAVVTRHACPLILMHMRGTPQNMQHDPSYDDVVTNVITYLRERLIAAQRDGVQTHQMLIDPGIGFGKTVEHNLSLLRALPQLESELDRPIVLGISRKSFISAVIGANDREGMSSAVGRDVTSHILHGLLAGQCSLLRVHDVPGAVAAVRLHQAVQRGEHGV